MIHLDKILGNKYLDYLKKEFNFVPKINNNLETQLYIRLYYPNNCKQTIELIEYWFYKSREPDLYLTWSCPIDEFSVQLDYKPRIIYF